MVEELENGRFESITQARLHHGIPGATTVQKWINKYGKNHLQAKVVRVEKPDEQDRIEAHTRHRMRQWLRSKYKQRQISYKSHSDAYLHTKLGLLNVTCLPAAIRVRKQKGYHLTPRAGCEKFARPVR